MQLEDRSECVSDLGFDEWFAGEAAPAQRLRLEAHVQACTRCRVRGELLERERAAFLAKAPTIAANSALTRGSAQPKRAPRRIGASVWLGLSAAALIGAIGFRIGLPRATGTQAGGSLANNGSGERLKGISQVGFYVKRGARVRRGVNGDTVHPGDQLRFTYSSERPAYLALLGRDQRSSSVYFPSGANAARVESGRDRALDFSLELDAQLGEEQLYVVLCPSDYALAPLRAELGQKGELQAPASCRIERIALRKETAP